VRGRLSSGRAGISLRARALKYLALREHSRAELERKLARYAQPDDDIARLLDELEQAGHLSQARFVDSLVRRRQERYGVRRIEHELGEHALAPSLAGAALQALRAGERERAMAVWARRFKAPPGDLHERARQHRFLAARGFEADTIAWVLKTVGASASSR